MWRLTAVFLYSPRAQSKFQPSHRYNEWNNLTASENTFTWNCGKLQKNTFKVVYMITALSPTILLLLFFNWRFVNIDKYQISFPFIVDAKKAPHAWTKMATRRYGTALKQLFLTAWCKWSPNAHSGMKIRNPLVMSKHLKVMVKILMANWLNYKRLHGLDKSNRAKMILH